MTASQPPFDATAYRCCPECAGAIMRFDPHSGEWGCACGVRTMLPGPAEPPPGLGDAAETTQDDEHPSSGAGCFGLAWSIIAAAAIGALGGLWISIALLHCGGVR